MRIGQTPGTTIMLPDSAAELYWTPERMASAVPFEHTQSGSGGPVAMPMSSGTGLSPTGTQTTYSQIYSLPEGNVVVDYDAQGNPTGVALMDPVTGGISTPPPDIVRQMMTRSITVPASPEAQAKADQLIPGVSNTLLGIAAAVLAFALIAGGRR